MMKYPYMREKQLYAICILRPFKSNGRYLNTSDFTCYYTNNITVLDLAIIKVVQRNPSGLRASSGQGKFLLKNSHNIIRNSHKKRLLHYFGGKYNFQRNRGAHSYKLCVFTTFSIIKVKIGLIGSFNKIRHLVPFKNSVNFHNNKALSHKACYGVLCIVVI